MSVKNLKTKFPKIKYICIGFGDEEANLLKLSKQLLLKQRDYIFKKYFRRFKIVFN